MLSDRLSNSVAAKVFIVQEAARPITCSRPYVRRPLERPIRAVPRQALLNTTSRQKTLLDRNSAFPADQFLFGANGIFAAENMSTEVDAGGAGGGPDWKNNHADADDGWRVFMGSRDRK